MTTPDNKSLVKISKKFCCKNCNYNTSRKYNFDLHINSNKHQISIMTTENNDSLVKVSKNHICLHCNKTFNDRAGLWRHNKKCKQLDNSICNCDSEDKINNTDEMSDKDLIMMLIKENSEMKNMMMEVIKNGTNHNNSHNNTTHTNSHNKAFNLNFFLNETCKDAMNIMDFVDSIKLQLSDLENVGKLGYVEGISNIIVKNLKELDITKRPVHCTDQKRETMYIKDENKWERENDNKNTLRKVIRKVACKNQNLIPSFKEAHPDCGKYHSKFSDQFNKIIVESMGGSGENDLEKEDKIIKNISKEVTVNK